MTAFSLFHHPSFERKLLAISSHLQLQALVAAIFSFSARYHDKIPGNLVPTNIPSHFHFRQIALQSVEEVLKQCDDEVPPLCLLQALVLITFDELIRGVRARAWRLLGQCVRIAYELQLHVVDKDLSNPSSRNNSIDILAEEKRRTWWAIWEFDVFASTIRRLPTAIDWAFNATCLPVEDNVWFANDYAKSCHLDPDPCLAWKSLHESGNQSPKAWFIVVNALMRSAHVLSYPQGYPNSTPNQRPGVAENVQVGLDILSNSLYCLTVALPPRLTYQGEYLAFSKSSGVSESLQLDSAKHNTHMMIQLSRFMINHYQVFDSTSRQLGWVKGSSQINQSTPAFNQSAWNHYLAAASEVVTLIRSCSPRHINYVNPFLSSTIWLAAAAQIVSKHIGQSLIDRRVADSNLDLLQTNMNATISTWGVSSALRQKLIGLKNRLDSFGGHIINNDQRDSRVGAQASEPMPPATAIGTEGLQGNEMRRDGTHVYASTGISQQNDSCTNDWSFQQGLDVTGTEFDPVMGLDLWGWGLDELLSYNSMNELSTY
jgi:hypothetical protein